MPSPTTPSLRRDVDKKTGLLLTGSMACAMTVLDSNVVGIVLPSIARDLNASFADIAWVISAFVLCFAALLLPAGAVADRYGRKRVLLCGISVYGLASVACGLAPSTQALYASRAVQGVGAAFLLAPALAVLGHAFHEEAERTRAWAIWGVIMGLAMVLSPIIGGVIDTYLGWRWAFHVNAPLCAILAAAVIKSVNESRDASPKALDFAGIGLFACGMFCLTWALILGSELGWRSPAVLYRTLAGLCFFGVFSIVERRRAHPMLDLALFASWPFVGAVVAMFAYAATAQVMATLLPLFLQNARGATTMTAGLAMLPFALAMLILPQAGRLLSRYWASYKILTLGLAIVAIGNLLLAWSAGTGNSAILVVGMVALGSGGGLLNGETQKAIMSVIPRHRVGMASGISTTARFSGILLGFSGLGAVLAARVRSKILEETTDMSVRIPSALLEQMVAGDAQRAQHVFPGTVGDTLLLLGRLSYAAGFSTAFLVATGLAAIAAGIVYFSMRRMAAHQIYPATAANRA
ncbi:MAG TPA: MFS transporter [Candidimonas sp.]|nr:MFS transporter [Candidimonas sp.]